MVWTGCRYVSKTLCYIAKENTNLFIAYKFPKAQERLEELKRGGSKVQMKRERLSRTNQKQQEENCTVM